MKFIMITFSHSQLNIFRKQFKKKNNFQLFCFSSWNVSASYRKDIYDLNGIHCHWRSTAAVTLIIHNNHEQVAAGNLLYDKRSAAQTQSLILKKSLMLVKCNQMILLDYYFMINRQFTLQHLMQPSHSMFPVVSLMVRSDTNAGYSVSHGTIMVLPRDLWAERETEQV